MSWRRELFLINVSEPEVMGPFSIMQVLPVKSKGVEESWECAVRNWVLHASGFGTALSGGCCGFGGLYGHKYIWGIGMSSAQHPAERGVGEGIWGPGEHLGEDQCQKAEKPPYNAPLQ